MYAHIHAVNIDDPKSGGRTTWVHAHNFNLEKAKSGTSQSDNPQQVLRITAGYSHDYSGWDDPVRTYHRTLVIELTEDDLLKIFRVAVEKQLFLADWHRNLLKARANIDWLIRKLKNKRRS